MINLPSTITPESYIEVTGDTLINLNNAADHVLELLQGAIGGTVLYGPLAVRHLADEIEKNRAQYNANKEILANVMFAYGAFLGRAIIENNAAGKVAWVDNQIDNYCLRIKTNKGQTSFSAPFTKVAKNLSNGAEDSIYAFYLSVDSIIHNGYPTHIGS